MVSSSVEVASLPSRLIKAMHKNTDEPLGNVMPPTADRVKRMADILGENPDEWIALAGRVPEDLPQIIQTHTEVPDLLRAVKGLTVEQLRKLREDAERMKREGK